MIKHILNIIWKQRGSNGWIFAELIIVLAIFWRLLDTLVVDLYTYYSPLGYDIENTYRFKISVLNHKDSGNLPSEPHALSSSEELNRLLANIKNHPWVEEACVTYYSCPYSLGNSWMSLTRALPDSTKNTETYHVRYVTPEYFDVFRVKDKNGASLRPQLAGITQPLIVSADMEAMFFPGESAKGQSLYSPDEPERLYIINAVCTPVRDTEFDKSEPCFYKCLSENDLKEQVEWMGVENAECCVRMRTGIQPSQMNDFFKDMGDRLRVNNIYVSTVFPLQEMRETQIRDRINQMKKKLALMGFMLINVFFGVIGTFWLRTQQRLGEIGLRMAVGATRKDIRKYLSIEGTGLLFLAVPLVLLFIFNMLYFEQLDTYRLPFTWWRFVIAFGGAWLFLNSMILLGIAFPAYKAVRIHPSDALHYE